ncbi:MAG: hypothetical protein II637_01360 [Bacteroidales bacterium]|nr:hypothetical protein [Bacteroidales bacterium]
MLKQFEVYVHVDGHYSYEDPKCPIYWRGFGCYNIEVDTWCDTELEVWANSEEEARKFAEEYDYAKDYIICIDDVIIEDIVFVADLDCDDEEAGAIETSIDWKEREYDM